MAKVIDRALMNRPKEKFWVSYIKQRINKNKNFLGFVSGQTGSGKSYSCLRIAEEIDPKFDIDRCVFSGIELMNLIDSGELKRGSVIIFEEVGVEMSNKNWASVANKMLNYLMQTFRHRNFILLMNAPYMDFVDASMRKLFHAEMRTITVDKDSNQVLLKPQIIQYNPRFKKFYYKRLKVITARGKLPVDIWRVDKPSAALLDAYESKKRAYTDRLNKRIKDELDAFHNKGNVGKPLTEIQQDVLDRLRAGETVNEIAYKRDRSVSVVFESMKLIKKKGYKLTPVYEGKKVVKYKVEDPA